MKKRELLRRIEALEARVRDLEARPQIFYTGPTVVQPPPWCVPYVETLPHVSPLTWGHEITCTNTTAGRS